MEDGRSIAIMHSPISSASLEVSQKWVARVTLTQVVEAAEGRGDRKDLWKMLCWL